MQVEPMGVFYTYLGMEAQSGYCSLPGLSALAACRKAYRREGGLQGMIIVLDFVWVIYISNVPVFNLMLNRIFTSNS